MHRPLGMMGVVGMTLALASASWATRFGIAKDETVSTALGAYNSIALDASGNPYISFITATTGNVSVARWDGNGWIVNTNGASGSLLPLRNTAIQVVGNTVHVVRIQTGTTTNLGYQTIPANFSDTTGWSGEGVWIESGLAGAPPVGEDFQPSFRVSGNTLAVSYSRLNPDSVRYAYSTNEGGSWNIETVANVAGRYSSLAFDSGGTPYVSYVTGEGLYVARREGANNWGTPQQVVAGNNFAYSSIAIASDGTIHIAYYNGSTGDLQLVSGTWGNWGTPETVDSTGDVGRYASLTLTAFNEPVISYIDDTNHQAKMAVKDKVVGGNNWFFFTLSSVPDTGLGRYTSAVYEPAKDWVHISYQGNSLRYAQATPEPSTWLLFGLGALGAMAWRRRREEVA